MTFVRRWPLGWEAPPAPAAGTDGVCNQTRLGSRFQSRHLLGRQIRDPWPGGSICIEGRSRAPKRNESRISALP
jgi:hypothetical protein